MCILSPYYVTVTEKPIKSKRKKKLNRTESGRGDFLLRRAHWLVVH